MVDVKRIKPTIPGGFRDYLPQDMIPRQQMFDTIRAIYERFGFSPLDTPAVERTEVLGGSTSKMRIYQVRLPTSNDDDEQQELSLHFDLTVPLARVVAKYGNELPRPFRRYQCAKVWRGERPQAGRYREFVQFDADVVGSDGVMGDAEIVWLMHDTMRALGIDRFTIRINNRKVLDGLAKCVGIEDISGEKGKELFRVLDKLEKIGWDGVATELRREPDSDVDVWALKLGDEAIAKIKRFIELDGTSREILAKLPEVLGDDSVGLQGISELEEMCTYLEAANLLPGTWKIDLSIARGLDYYTGPVFETSLNDLPGIGSVFSGGRYDDLVSRFGDMSLPATGASIGVDRLFTALEQLKLIKTQSTVTQVLITDFSPDLRTEYFKIAAALRNVGLKAEIYQGTKRAFKAQMAYAASLEIPILVILGANEKEKGVAAVKNMRTRTQSEVPIPDLATFIQSQLQA